MKRLTSLIFLGILIVIIAAGCSSKKEDLTLDKKNKPLPDYVLNSSEKVKETYLMAAKHPDVLAQVQCFCGCAADGHKSNLDCFIGKMGANNAVEEWDNHGISWDLCVDIAREATEMHLDGKSPKEIYRLINAKYKDVGGEPTPTPQPK